MISFRSAWRQRDPELERLACEFWRNLDVLSPPDIEERVGQLCAVALVNDQVVAASTAVPHDYPRLRSRFAYYLTMVAPGMCRQNMASRLCAFSRDRLAEWSREHPEEKIKGLFIVLQAEEFRHRQHVPIGTQLDLRLVLVGYTPSGYQMRVVWFDDATVE